MDVCEHERTYKHAILGFKIEGDFKTRIVPEMPLSSKTTNVLLPSPRCVEYMSDRRNFSAICYDKDGLPYVRIYEDICVDARVI
jgi:hypothetical protein